MTRWLALIALICIAALAGWWLLRPLPPRVTRALPQAPATELPAVATVQPVATPSPQASALPPAPTSSPSPAMSPATALTANPNGAQLALIVDDCGQWLQTERGFIALDVPLTLSVLPHVRYGTLIAQEATQAGKGVMLHLPMEPLSAINPGPGKITTEMNDAQITAQVRDDLADVPLARGVNNHEGSKASADPRVMRDVLAVLADRGLFFIDSLTSAASVGEQTARAMGVPTAARSVFLDNRADVAYSEQQLLEAAAIARRTGSAIAIGHPRPTTLAAVAQMIPKLEASGIRFVLAGQLVTADPRATR